MQAATCVLLAGPAAPHVHPRLPLRQSRKVYSTAVRGNRWLDQPRQTAPMASTAAAPRDGRNEDMPAA
eukprot:202195-Prymnesium_polylepis.2